MSQTKTPEASDDVYDSAVDWWVWLILLAGPLTCVGVAFVLLSQARWNDALVVLGVGLGTIIFTALFTVPCRYTFQRDALAVRCGVLHYRIEFKRIQGIEKSGSLLSGAALSLRRVKISTPSTFYLVSPKQRDVFIERLNEAVAEYEKSDADSSEPKRERAEASSGDAKAASVASTQEST